MMAQRPEMHYISQAWVKKKSKKSFFECWPFLSLKSFYVLFWNVLKKLFKFDYSGNAENVYLDLG